MNITMRWSQAGFNSFEGGDTPRNLFGFKDGTGNPQGKALDETVWYQDDNWLKNGTFLVARRIQMHLETWDRTNLNGQEETFGRHRDSGAPIGKKQEFDTVNLEQKDEKGKPVIPEISHLHLAKKTGLQMLRRSLMPAVLIRKQGSLMQACCLSHSKKIRNNLLPFKTALAISTR